MMKKTVASVALIFLAFLILLWFYAPLREFTRPHLPSFIQNLLLAPADGANPSPAAQGNRRGSGGPIAVLVAVAETGSLPLIERTYGVIKSPAVALVNARVASQITAINVKDGQMVKAGDLLITLDDRLLQAQLSKDQSVLLKDQAQDVSNMADLKRTRDLANSGIGSKQAADQALAAQKASSANIAADQAAIVADTQQLAFTKITAPIAGRLGAISAVVGNLVITAATSTSLMTITQLQPLKVGFQLPDRTLTDIRTALQAGTNLPVRVLQTGTTTELESGNLDFVDSAVDTTSGTIAMSATVDNDKLALWPGQFVDIEITRGTLANVIVIPTVAVQPSQSGSFVWLMKDDGTVAMAPVSVAQSEGDRSAITTGLKAGDKVIVEGQLKLKDGSAVTVIDPNAPPAADATAPADGDAAPADGSKKHKKKTQ